jgi:hypothetical protein
VEPIYSTAVTVLGRRSVQVFLRLAPVEGTAARAVARAPGPARRRALAAKRLHHKPGCCRAGKLLLPGDQVAVAQGEIRKARLDDEGGAGNSLRPVVGPHQRVPAIDRNAPVQIVRRPGDIVRSPQGSDSMITSAACATLADEAMHAPVSAASAALAAGSRAPGTMR